MSMEIKSGSEVSVEDNSSNESFITREETEAALNASFNILGESPIRIAFGEEKCVSYGKHKIEN